jgi:putative oxidoreductase
VKVSPCSRQSVTSHDDSRTNDKGHLQTAPSTTCQLPNGTLAMQIQKHIEKLLGLLDRQDWIAQLLVRLFVGYFFVETGWGKLHNLEGFAQRFAGWGIPYPHFNAALSAYTEFVGGLLIVFGMATRLATIPMIINMMVAILAVNLKRVSSLDDFVELDEPLYALTFLWLLLSGPGWVSFDYIARCAFGGLGRRDRMSQVGHDQSISLKTQTRLVGHQLS